MRIKPIAADSMGTRSMCTLVEHKGFKIVIDPSAALGPYRYGLRPHPKELERLREHKSTISELSSDADLLVITHYHYDHVPRPGEDISWMKEKKLLVKDPERSINFSQKKRAMLFLSDVKSLGCSITLADGRRFSLGGLDLIFSDPVQHGNSARLGYVLQLCIKSGDSCFLYTSDVEGPAEETQLSFILKHRPKVIMCDGPMTYMLGGKFSEDDLRRSKENISRILRKCRPDVLVLDHHLVRDIDWRCRLADIEELARIIGTKIQTAASFAGMKEEPLEAMRRMLYEGSV